MCGQNWDHNISDSLRCLDLNLIYNATKSYDVSCFVSKQHAEAINDDDKSGLFETQGHIPDL